MLLAAFAASSIAQYNNATTLKSQTFKPGCLVHSQGKRNEMIHTRIQLKRYGAMSSVVMLLTGVLSSGIFTFPVRAQAAKSATAYTPVSAAKPSSIHGSPSRYTPSHFPKRAAMYYESIWGVDSLSVKAVESGELIRFSYRIIDPSKAAIFKDKKQDAFLDLPVAHARLVIPTLEKVGQLRQYNTPVPGTSYWMAFSNPRRTVKRGDRVNVVIGQFHADGLLVE